MSDLSKLPRTRMVEMSNELVGHMLNVWSEPLDVRITAESGDVVELEFRYSEEVRRLSREVEALRGDKERLDWMEANVVASGGDASISACREITEDQPTKFSFTLNSWHPEDLPALEYEGSTIREAIDAARLSDTERANDAG